MSRKGKPIKTKRFYICDPKKNTSCEGRGKPNWCGKVCFCTTSIQFAKDTKQLTKNEYVIELDRRLNDGN